MHIQVLTHLLIVVIRIIYSVIALMLKVPAHTDSAKISISNTDVLIAKWVRPILSLSQNKQESKSSAPVSSAEIEDNDVVKLVVSGVTTIMTRLQSTYVFIHVVIRSLLGLAIILNFLFRCC